MLANIHSLPGAVSKKKQKIQVGGWNRKDLLYILNFFVSLKFIQSHALVCLERCFRCQGFEILLQTDGRTLPIQEDVLYWKVPSKNA